MDFINNAITTYHRFFISISESYLFLGLLIPFFMSFLRFLVNCSKSLLGTSDHQTIIPSFFLNDFKIKTHYGLELTFYSFILLLIQLFAQDHIKSTYSFMKNYPEEYKIVFATYVVFTLFSFMIIWISSVYVSRKDSLEEISQKNMAAKRYQVTKDDLNRYISEEYLEEVNLYNTDGLFDFNKHNDMSFKNINKNNWLHVLNAIAGIALFFICFYYMNLSKCIVEVFFPK
jgi:hypothetical protein